MPEPEPVVLGVVFGAFAIVQVIGWYRDERQLARLTRAHRADLAAIRAEAVRLGHHDEIRMFDEQMTRDGGK